MHVNNTCFHIIQLLWKRRPALSLVLHLQCIPHIESCSWVISRIMFLKLLLSTGTPETMGAMSACYVFVNIFNASYTGHGETSVRPIQDKASRLWSTFFVIVRLIRLKTYLALLEEQGDPEVVIFLLNHGKSLLTLNLFFFCAQRTKRNHMVSYMAHGKKLFNRVTVHIFPRSLSAF